MLEQSTILDRFRRFGGPVKSRRYEYTQKILSGALKAPSAFEAATLQAPHPSVEKVQALVGEAQAGSIVFQSVAVAAYQRVERALFWERQAAAAAISLGQREKLGEMVETLEEVAEALRRGLNGHGAQMLSFQEEGDEVVAEPSWWFALTEAIEALERGIECMISVAAGQAKGTPARRLGGVLARLFHAHHNALLHEADHWMSS